MNIETDILRWINVYFKKRNIECKVISPPQLYVPGLKRKSSLKTEMYYLLHKYDTKMAILLRVSGPFSSFIISLSKNFTVPSVCV